MRLQDILAAVPGLEKRFVHYLESQGYIAPEKLQKASIARRDYSEGDLDRIRGIWRYYQRGISIARAYELVAREPATWAYVLLPVPTRSWQAALDHLSLSDKVREAGIIYAETADVIARLRVTHESDVHDVLDRLFEDGLVAGVPRVYRYAQAFPGRHLTPPNRPEERMKAWSLIKVPAKQIGPLVDHLRDVPGIVEASGIYGETDVIAKVEVPDPDALDELVTNRIQTISVVESTRTFIGIGRMHWDRDTATA
jgi:DNA-binding Lrp family transcriptional regulator